MVTSITVEFEVLAATIAYVNGGLSLRELEECLASRLLVLLSLPPSTARRLAGLIELGTAEIDDGIETEAGLRRKLAGVLDKEGATAHLLAAPEQHILTFGTTATTVKTPITTGLPAPLPG